MILVITFTISSGVKITYELNESVYTYRVIGNDEEGQMQDQIQILLNGNRNMYNYDFNSLELKSKELLNELDVRKLEGSYEITFAEEFKLNGRHGFKMERDILKNSCMASYYIQINELNELTKRTDFLKDIAIIKDNYLYVFADFASGDSELDSIENVVVQWKDNFSEKVESKLKMIQTLEDNKK